MEVGNVHQPQRRLHITIRAICLASLILFFLRTIRYMWILESTAPSLTERTYKTVYRSELEMALAETATKDKTLIITFLDKVEEESEKQIFELFLEGFYRGEGTQNLRNHLLVASADRRAYLQCKFYQRHCYMLKNRKEFDGDRWYTPDEFVDNMLERTLFLAKVLKLGYDFIFTDTDVIWLRNPFPVLLHSQRPSEAMDLQIHVDKFNGNQSSEDNPINTGFYMVRSNYRTVMLFNDWFFKILNQKSVTKEQDALQMLMKEGHFRKLGLKVRFLNTLYFSGFCEDRKDFRVVATVHANCCQNNTKAKVKDLRTVINDWNRFRSSPGAPFEWSKHQYCRPSRNDSKDV